MVPAAVLVVHTTTGNGFAVTVTAADVFEHPPLVIVTVWLPEVEATYVLPVAPVIVVPLRFHTYVYPTPVFELSVTLPPAQNVVLPPAVTVAVTVVGVPTHWQLALHLSLIVQALPSLQLAPGTAGPPTTPWQSTGALAEGT